MSIHRINGISYSVHFLLTNRKGDMTTAAWKVVVGTAKGLQYLHCHEKGAILHNDLKNDNVVVGSSFNSAEPCIVDFGKACFQ